MPIVRYVAFFPPSGFADRRWLEDPSCDALVKTARRVGELYSQEVERLGLAGKASEVRFFADPGPAGTDVVAVNVHLDFLESFEIVKVQAPRGVDRLDPQARAELVLEILHGSMLALAPRRGWSVEALESAAANARAAGLEFTWSSAWKASADRRREARATYRLDDDGFGRAVIEVRDRGGAGTGLVRSPSERAYSTSAGFKRSAKALRWEGSEVTLTASIDILARKSGHLRFDPATATTAGALPARAALRSSDAPRPSVVIASSAVDSDSPRINFIGGGPTNGVPVLYLHELDRTWRYVESEYLSWWSAADRNLLEVTFEITEGSTGTRVRRLQDRVSAVIRRDRASFRPLRGRSLAHEDVEALLAAVGKRMDLGAPPSLPIRLPKR